ncbi:unnamed protein product [Eruca vesicaria subsp. sativa]|uniref:Uncharacterized protein n=1 Tax=Eruca vesicaria subsp. sativa TaxID=29727 RepID=A0ABC8M6Q0_ERUVS|nr:unnamed protein product [Eruca vesicaria subsp. sativa]
MFTLLVLFQFPASVTLLWKVTRMQGERASIGSTSSNPVVEHLIRWDNDLQNYMSSAAADTNTSLSNSVYHEQRDLHRFILGEASSSGPKNEAPSEQWMQMGRFEE